jgi:hypothetical protein
VQLRNRAAAAVLLLVLALAPASRLDFRPQTAAPGVDQQLIAITIPPGREAAEYEPLVDRIAASLAAIKDVRHVQSRLPDPGELMESVIPHFTLMLSPKELERVAAKLTTEAIRSSVRRNRTVLETPQAVAAKELVQHDPFNLLPIFLEKFGAGGDFEFDPFSGLLLSKDGSTILILAQPARPASDLNFARDLTAHIRSIAREPEVLVAGDHAVAVEDVEIARRWALAGVVLVVVLCSIAAWAFSRSTAFAINTALIAAAALFLLAGLAAVLPIAVPIGHMPGNDTFRRQKVIERKFGVAEKTSVTVVTGATLDETLQKTLTATERLPAGSWTAITQFVPPRARQLESIEALRAGRNDRFSIERIRDDFTEALEENGFRPGAYDQYLQRFGRALAAEEPVGPETLKGEPFTTLRDRFLRRTATGYESLIYVTRDLK